MLPIPICTFWQVYIIKTLSFLYPAVLLPPLFALKSTVPSFCPLPFLLQTTAKSHQQTCKKPKRNEILLHSILPSPTWSLRAVSWGRPKALTHQRPVQGLQQQCPTQAGRAAPAWGRGTRQAALYPCDTAHGLHVLFGFRIKNHVKVH